MIDTLSRTVQQEKHRMSSKINSSLSRSVARAVQQDEQMNINGPRGNPISASGLPSRSFRYLQDQYKNGNGDSSEIPPAAPTDEPMAPEGVGLRRGSDSHMPSRSFKYLQDQYDAQQTPVNRSQPVNNREDLSEIYNKRKIGRNRTRAR